MLDLILIVFVFWLGYNVGQMVLSWQLRDIIRAEARKEGIKVRDDYTIQDDDDTPDVSKLYIEREQDTMYLYDHDKKAFVCQAKTHDELAKLALEYKNIKYAAVLDGEHTYMFVDGGVKQHT
jgi:hypothetical protein